MENKLDIFTLVWVLEQSGQPGVNILDLRQIIHEKIDKIKAKLIQERQDKEMRIIASTLQRREWLEKNEREIIEAGGELNDEINTNQPVDLQELVKNILNIKS